MAYTRHLINVAGDIKLGCMEQLTIVNNLKSYFFILG